jgi:hypothetical protein
MASEDGRDLGRAEGAAGSRFGDVAQTLGASPVVTVRLQPGPASLHEGCNRPDYEEEHHRGHDDKVMMSWIKTP